MLGVSFFRTKDKGLYRCPPKLGCENPGHSVSQLPGRPDPIAQYSYFARAHREVGPVSRLGIHALIGASHLG